jgi:thiamine-phosphate pyrophosphorylase
MAERPSFALYLVTDGSAPLKLTAAVSDALRDVAPGRVAVQLRDKKLEGRALHDLALELRTITRERGCALLINDRVDIARAVQADGVHLPEHGVSIEAARMLLGETAWIGKSCHDLHGLRHAADSGADLAVLSPVFESPRKGATLGVERFGELTREVAMPVYALGGIRIDNASQLRGSGAAGLAVISAVFEARDRAAAVNELLDAWDGIARPKD